ncbi:serine/threonine-protein kinase PAK 3-like [Melospiza georgiana]|nr:serine/threonine-protein kinase PAK 3-like [Melospiza georgiana]
MVDAVFELKKAMLWLGNYNGLKGRRGAVEDPLNKSQLTEPRAVSPLAPAAPGEEAQEEQIEMEEHQAPSVLTPEPGYCEPKIKAEPQAELPEAQSAIMDVKNMNKEDMGRNQEENLHQQRGDQQNQVQELTSDRAACKDFQQMSGNEGPQVKSEAQEQCPPVPSEAPEVPQVQHIKGSESAAAAALPGRSHSVKPGTSSLGSSFISPKQETEKRYLEMLGKMVNQENPVMKYTEKERIGSGGFGQVVRALNNATGGEVAIKKINLKGLRSKQLTVNEIMIMKRYRSPSVVNYLDSYLLGEELWLVMEFMDGGTLSDVITKTCLSEDHMAAICRECLQGLYFLHSNHVIHRDVKSGNILLRSDGSVKLADFGLSTQLTPEQSRRCSVAGTTWWLAPEMVTHQPYGPKVDIWSFGIVGIEMVEQGPPYWNRSPASVKLLIAVIGTPRLRHPNRFSPCLRDFLSHCLQTDEQQRWSAKELLKVKCEGAAGETGSEGWAPPPLKSKASAEPPSSSPPLLLLFN